MNHDRVQTNQFKQYDIVGKRLLEAFFCHGVAAVFHNNGFAMKAFQIGQCLGKHLGFECDVFVRLSDGHIDSVGQK